MRGFHSTDIDVQLTRQNVGRVFRPPGRRGPLRSPGHIGKLRNWAGPNQTPNGRAARLSWSPRSRADARASL
eukprot:9392431-Lingulodinium_polyedra.AAC.1